MRVQTEEWRRFIPGVRMYKGKLTYFYNGENIDGYQVYSHEERQKWKVIMVLPGVEIIPQETFSECKNIETVIMSDSVKRIEWGAFEHCESLKFVRLSKNIKCIEDEAFYGCKSLTSIFIPESCRKICEDAFAGCEKLIILTVPRHTTLEDNVFDDTASMRKFLSCKRSKSFDEWIKQRLNRFKLHKLCCSEDPLPDLDSFNSMDWFKKDDYNLTPIDYFIANFGEGEHIANLPEYVQYLIQNQRLHELKELSTDEIVEMQDAWQKEQNARQKEEITSLQSQLAELKKDRDYFMSVALSEEESKCSLCYNKFSTDLNSALPEIRQFLPVLSRAACPHYFCQGCVEKSQLAAAENAPRKKVLKWLKCMVCKQKTAFCPEDPFYHTKLIQLLERARRCHPIDVKVEEGHEEVTTSSTSNDNRASKRAKVANVAIKEES